MYTETIRFEEVKRQFIKNLPCPGCGRKVRRQRTFCQTLNPWNKRADGMVKSRLDIWDGLAERGMAWQSEAVRCARCEATP
ncbi:MAG TPA: hypothetical protein VMU94_18190 [Streptosporangiaceae bacterium]|nr:hypothetical protein [Streptosporangiaceae bacterium]